MNRAVNVNALLKKQRAVCYIKNKSEMVVRVSDILTEVQKGYINMENNETIKRDLLAEIEADIAAGKIAAPTGNLLIRYVHNMKVFENG